MWVLYDFETSTRELLGQITAYSFHLVDTEWTVIQQLSGYVKLNRTEIPDIDAIRITQFSPSFLDENGLPESKVAELIFQFLSSCVSQYGSIKLVGYNSNQFDLKFLRSLLIRYGYNPYFFGKIKNIDAYHYVQHLAFNNPEVYPWQCDASNQWRFRLETVATSHGVLDTHQRHDADEDVILLRSTLMTLENRYRYPFAVFSGCSLPDSSEMPAVVAQTVRGIYPEKITKKNWHILFASKSDLIVVDLDKALNTPIETEGELMSICRYINPNTHFFITEPADRETTAFYAPVIQHIHAQVDALSFSRDRYFESIQPDWDIQYRLHDLGFQRIDEIGKLIRSFQSNWQSATATLNSLWAAAKGPKDSYLVQLLNRYLMNNSPTPPANAIKKYAMARYVTGDLIQFKNGFRSVYDQLEDAKREQAEQPSGLMSAYIEFVSERIKTLGIDPLPC